MASEFARAAADEIRDELLRLIEFHMSGDVTAPVKTLELLSRNELAEIINRLAVEPVLATKLTPEAVADILTQDQVGGLVYRGNSVSFLYDKMLAYKASVGRARDSGIIAGREDMKPEVAAARRAGAEDMRERAVDTTTTLCRTSKLWNYFQTGQADGAADYIAERLRALPLDAEEQT